jgi:hypothetical protein
LKFRQAINLIAKIGAGDRDRTDDIQLGKLALNQDLTLKINSMLIPMSHLCPFQRRTERKKLFGNLVHKCRVTLGREEMSVPVICEL